MTETNTSREWRQAPQTDPLREILLSQGFEASEIEALDLKPHGVVMLERIEDTTEAQLRFKELGAVMFAPTAELSEGLRIGEVTAGVVGHLRERISGEVLFPGGMTPEEFAPNKDMVAYNGTGRQMRIMDAHKVWQLPEVVEYQKQILPFVRSIVGDETVEVSVDPSEATVINSQVFDLTKESGMQQHGAHVDRVDTTIIACVENVGVGGDLVLVNGLFEACVDMGIDPNGQFKDLFKAVLEEGKHELLFQVVRMVPGDTVLLKSDTTIHFITPKQSSDVRAGFEADENRAVTPFGKSGVLGRGIINASFETGRCREIDALAVDLEKKALPEGTDYRTVDLLGESLDWIDTVEIPDSLKDMDQKVLANLVANASYGRQSSYDLYAEPTDAQ